MKLENEKLLSAIDFLVESKVGTTIRDHMMEKKGAAGDVEKGNKKKEKAEEKKKEDKKDEAKELKQPVFLQAGSFAVAQDADNQKARLALMGMEATFP